MDKKVRPTEDRQAGSFQGHAIGHEDPEKIPAQDRRMTAGMRSMTEKRHVKILLVDDDEDDYIITRDMLREARRTVCQLDWAPTFEAGRDAIMRKEHDLYLLDFRLGKHTGLELLTLVAGECCKAPVILLTGQGDHDADIEAMRAGASDYLVKGGIDAPLLERSILYSLERKQWEEQIRQLAYYDCLTNLPNRMLFEDRLEQTVEQARRYERLTGVLFLDLDNFKRINDTLGHRMGDLLLKMVAERLMGCVRGSDSVARPSTDEKNSTVSRLGGDEFTIILVELRHAHDAATVAQRIIDEMSRPFLLGGREVFISVSIGIGICPQDGEDVTTLLRNADAAMYYAKEQGKSNYQFYAKSINSASLQRLALENDLRKALERNEFQVYYQPQIEISTGKMIGMEALLRWRRGGGEMISPGEFIPLAEEIGLIVQIGEWVLHNACMQNSAWQKAGFPRIPVSVNLSSHQFRHRGILKTITEALSASGLDPECLILEITETVIMQNTDATLRTLHQLNAMGLRLSLDDFGTGYSSLSYLNRFPLFAIKIDRSFTKDITVDAYSAAITRAIIAMAHSLAMKVVSEGVETEEQLGFLSNLNCDEMQGYLVSKPLAVEEVTKLLAREKAGTGVGLAICAKSLRSQ